MSISRGCSFAVGASGARIFHLLFCCLTSDVHFFLKRYCEGNGLRLIWPPGHTNKSPPPKKNSLPHQLFSGVMSTWETFSMCCKALLGGCIWAPRTPEFFSPIGAGQRKAPPFLRGRSRRLSPDAGLHRRGGAEVCAVTITGSDRTPCIYCLF